MAKVRTSRSLPKPSGWQLVRDGTEQWLCCGLTASQRIAADAPLVPVHLNSDQPVGPCGLDGKALAQQGHVALCDGPTQIDQAATGRSLEVQAPLRGKRPPRWSPLDPRRSTTVIGGHIARRLGLQGRQGLMMEPAPHLRLPTPIVTLDGRLKAGFLRGSTHRDDLQAQAQADHPPDGIGMLMRSPEAGIMIELGVGRQAPCLPMLEPGVGDDRRGDRGPRPRADQALLQRDHVQHFDLGAALDHEPLHHVKALNLCPLGRHLRQIPAAWWGPAADPLAGIQRPPPRQHPLIVRREGTVGIPRWSSSRRIAAAPNSPSALVSLLKEFRPPELA
jgi:hypothetical protein